MEKPKKEYSSFQPEQFIVNVEFSSLNLKIAIYVKDPFWTSENINLITLASMQIDVITQLNSSEIELTQEMRIDLLDKAKSVSNSKEAILNLLSEIYDLSVNGEESPINRLINEYQKIIELANKIILDQLNSNLKIDFNNTEPQNINFMPDSDSNSGLGQNLN